MPDKPNPPAEATLIQKAVTRLRLSAREAATRAGISEGRWRQIVSGYQSARGQHIPVTAPATTLAHMAKAVGVTPDELAAAGRADAAEILTDLAAHQPAAPSLPAGSDNDEALVRVMRSDLADTQKRRLVQMLIAERDAAERQRVERAQNLIDLMRGQG